MTGQEAFGRLPHARLPVRRAGARARPRAQALGAAVAPRRSGWCRRGSGCRCTSTRRGPARWCRPRASPATSSAPGDGSRRGGRPPDAHPPRDRGLDGRRGALPRVRRRRRRELRRLPRRQGHRLRVDRRGRSTTTSGWRSCSSAIDLRDRQQFLVAHRDDDVGRDAVAPVGRGRGLFVHRQAFCEPARHAMLGEGQDVNMAHSCQACSPSGTRRACDRRGCPSRPRSERHTQRAQARQAHGADGEVLVIRIDLHLHRPLQLELVLPSYVAIARFISSGNRGAALRLLRVKLQDGGRSRESHEVLEGVDQFQGIAGGRILVW